MATDLFEHDMKKLNLLSAARGRNSFGKVREAAAASCCSLRRRTLAIPEAQLDTWANSPPSQQFTDTYATIKNVLELQGRSLPARARTSTSSCRGHIATATNVYGDSDVDIVVCQTSSFLYSLDRLGPAEQDRLLRGIPRQRGNTCCRQRSRSDVTAWLQKQYPGALDTSRKKAMFLKGNGSSRRDADILVCSEYHDYYNFPDGASEGGFYPRREVLHDRGRPDRRTTRSSTSNGARTRTKTPNGNFKATVRIYKNMRKRLIDDRLLADGVAPSYYIEGMLYNVDDDVFTGTYQSMVLGSYRWVRAADRLQALVRQRHAPAPAQREARQLGAEELRDVPRCDRLPVGQLGRLKSRPICSPSSTGT